VTVNPVERKKYTTFGSDFMCNKIFKVRNLCGEGGESLTFNRLYQICKVISKIPLKAVISITHLVIFNLFRKSVFLK
jgi:hypothetical protein